MNTIHSHGLKYRAIRALCSCGIIRFQWNHSTKIGVEIDLGLLYSMTDTDLQRVYSCGKKTFPVAKEYIDNLKQIFEE